MKVALVSSSSGSRGGGELYLVSLAEGLSRLGHDPLTVLSTHAQMDELEGLFLAKGLRVLRWDYTNSYQRRSRVVGAVADRRGVHRLARHLQSFSPDVIHVNQQNVEDGLDLLLAASQTRIPAVSTVHVTHSMQRLGAVAGRIRDGVSRHVFRKTRIPSIAISPASARDLSEFLSCRDGMLPGNEQSHGEGLLTSGVYCVPNGVAVPRVGGRAELRTRWNVPSDAIVLGVIARIEAQKNPLFLPRLLSQLPENVHVVWVGDGRMRMPLEREILECDVTARFHLIGWQTDAAAQLSGFDIFVLPSLYEGLPLALLEAMGAGLPCVVSAVDGTADAIESERSGFLCPVNDQRAWLAALQLLVTSAPLRKTIGMAAKDRHRCEFSLDAMAERTVAVYEDVVKVRHAFQPDSSPLSAGKD